MTTSPPSPACPAQCSSKLEAIRNNTTLQLLIHVDNKLKSPATMSSNSDKEELRRGNNNCIIFMDATPPICGVVNRLGQHCTPCRRALGRARSVFAGATRDERSRLLQRETANLTAATEHFNRIRETAIAETAAWRLATADVERQREILLRQREADEAQLAQILAHGHRLDEEHQE